MIKDKRGRILCIKDGKLHYVSPFFVKSEQFKVLGWKIVETPDAVKTFKEKASKIKVSKDIESNSQPVESKEESSNPEEEAEQMEQIEQNGETLFDEIKISNTKKHK